MRFTETAIRGAFIIDLEPHVDDRGFFARAFCANEFAEHGLTATISQVNTSFNHRRGTLRGLHYQDEPATQAWLEKAQRIEAVCKRHGVPLKAAAVQFPLGHPAVASVLAGSRSVAEVEENAAMLAFPIPADLWAELRAEGLLAAHVPTPGADAAPPARGATAQTPAGVATS